MLDVKFLINAAKNFLSKKKIFFLIKERDGKIFIYFSDGKNTQNFEFEQNKWISINDLFKILENGNKGK